MSDSFSILDIGRRIHTVSAECLKLEEMTKPGRQDEVRMNVLDEEQTLLQDLVVVLRPKTLAEVAVKVATMLYNAEADVHGDDLEDMRRGMHKIRRALPDIARVVAAAANIDLAQFCPTDMIRFMDGVCGPEPTKADDTDRGRW